MESTRWRARTGVVLVCRAAVELTTDYLERALSRRDRRRFEAHVRVCAGCRVYLEQLIASIAALRTLRTDDRQRPAR